MTKNNKNLAVLILAAGKGQRMKSKTPKILHNVAGKAMLAYSIDIADKLTPEKTVIVVGKHFEDVVNNFGGENLIFCEQTEQRGTADAVMAARSELENFDGPVLILYGDMPNINYETVCKFIRNADTGCPNFISVKMTNPKGYGRVVRAGSGEVIKIVEDRDADENIKKINEVNTGIYYCDAKMLFERLSHINNDNAQGEYYLTDIIHAPARGWCAENQNEFLGVNDRLQLAEVSKLIWYERARNIALSGVTIYDLNSVYIDSDVNIENDVTLYPNVYLEGKTTILKGTVVHSGARIIDSSVNRNCTIKENTLIEESEIHDDCVIGPMAHIRPHTLLKGSNRIGNFVELKSAELGVGSKASHLSYLGDCVLGENVNIGCGTITCNYDGHKKHKTIIEDNVFIGSDVQLVAPVVLGEGAVVGAGSTITKSVEADALAVCRSEQVNYPGKAKVYHKIKSGK